MTTVQSSYPLAKDFDFTDPDLLAAGMPIDEFALLRKTAPVWWNAQSPGTYVIDDGGYWVISRHADIRAISRNNDLWSTSAKGAIMRLPGGMTPEQLELTKVLLINHDPPAHTRLRKLVSPLFTPRAIAVLESGLATAARELVNDTVGRGSGDFVEDVAMRLPLLAIANLLGVPESDHRQLFEWTNSIMNSDDPDYGGDPSTANAELVGYFYAMAEERRHRPTDDIVSRLIHAEIDGEQLREDEFAFFVVLLAVAGNETTRNAITQGMNAFFDHPDQWKLYIEQRPSTAVDEIVRWASPVHCLQRTAKRDTRVACVDIAEGQRVGLFYSSANYDEAVFDQPFEFNILRDPNPHLGFGGTGAHFCIGASLARMEIRLIFDALADITPDISKLAEPVRLRSGWLNGVKELKVTYASSRPS